jgi:hypothetical protein
MFIFRPQRIPKRNAIWLTVYNEREITPKIFTPLMRNDYRNDVKTLQEKTHQSRIRNWNEKKSIQ